MFEYIAKVTNVVDGDTIDVAIDLGFSLVFNDRVRLAGINSYEIKLGKDTTQEQKTLGIEAKSFLSDLLLGNKVRLVTVKDREKYGRYLANVYVTQESVEVLVNDLMIQKGYAIKYMC